MPGLVNGTSYRFKVAAVAGSATGLESSPSSAVLVGAPGAPRSVTVAATGGAGSVAVGWQAPLAVGTGVTGYRVIPFLGGLEQPAVEVVGGETHQVQVTGLDAGGSYTFRVEALSVHSAGPRTASTRAVVPS